jgi:hypothetical protein
MPGSEKQNSMFKKTRGYVQDSNPFAVTSCGRRRNLGSPLLEDGKGGGRKSIKLSKKQQDVVFPGLKSKPKKSSNEPRKTTKGKGRNFRTVKEGAGMTAKGVAEYKRKNPGSKLQTAVTGDVKPGSKAAGRRKSFCARSKGWTGERGRAARRRWKC